MRKNILILQVFAIAILLCSCMPAQQRGMAGAQYVSTSRPCITMGVADSMPLISGGRGTAKLTGAGVMGGLLVDAWLATYGNAQQGPLAIIAHADVPESWYWDGISPHPFSVDAGYEVINDTGFDAWTYATNNKRNPFWKSEVASDADDNRWIVRCFAMRTDFDRGKIILEYRERLPKDITTLTSMPLGYGDYLKEFAQRARAVFTAASASAIATPIKQGAITNVRWQYMNESFWGTVSRKSDNNLR